MCLTFTIHTRHNYIHVDVTRGATNFILRYADCVARVTTMLAPRVRFITPCVLCVSSVFPRRLKRVRLYTSQVKRAPLTINRVDINGHKYSPRECVLFFCLEAMNKDNFAIVIHSMISRIKFINVSCTIKFHFMKSRFRRTFRMYDVSEQMIW